MIGSAYNITLTGSADRVLLGTGDRLVVNEPFTDGSAKAHLSVSHLPHAAALLGPSGVVLEHNQAFARLMGHDGISVTDHALIEALSAGDSSRLRLGLAFVERAQPHEDTVLSFALKLHTGGTDERQIWLEARPISASLWIAHLYRDHPVLAHGLAIHGGDGAALIGTDGRIRIITAASGQFLCTDPIHLVDEPFTSLATPEDRADLENALAVALAHPSEACQSPLVAFNLPWGGTDNPCLAARVMPLTLLGHESARGEGGAIALLRDMASLKSLEGERDSALKTAEQASRTKSRFLAGMSHELRTPLNAIIGFSDILQQEMFGPLGNERYKEYIGLIRESGLAMLQLVTDILDLARIETGRYALRLERVDAETLIKAEVEKWHKRAALKNIAVDAALPPSAPVLHADRLALSQILTNLLSNAVKYTEAGGQVTVAAEEVGDTINLVVMDTGQGIEPDLLPKLGRPFEQLVAETSANGGGNGIGLALVHALAKLHQGAVVIDSTLGEGTTVTVRLPREIVPQAEDRPGEAADAPASPSTLGSSRAA